MRKNCTLDAVVCPKYRKSDYVIRVTKQEAMEVRKKFPDLFVTRTCKQHPRKSTYYATETPGVLALLHQLRGRPVETDWTGTDRFDGHKVKED